MFEMIYKFLILYYKWLCLIEAAYVLVIGLIALLALVVNILKLIFRQDSIFRYYHLLKVVLAAGAAYLYYYIYQMKDFSKYIEHQQIPVQVVALIIILLLPIGVVQYSDMIFLEGHKPKKKK
ncbi:MAG TPA: hypothetical protein VK791_09965 [bacterium]|jgi:hypothetical protein|nr:hypothetical protein [bacterium]